MEGAWMQEGGERGPRERAVDLPALMGAVGLRKWWILVPTAAAFLLALAVVTLLPPRYTGVAKVLLENQESYYTRPDKAGAEPAPTLDPEAVQSEAETILSPDLARRAIAELGLGARPEFNPAASSSAVATLLGLIGFDGSGAGPAREARVLELFLSRLTVFPVAKSRVLQIEFVSEDPELAARGANLVAQLFLAGQESAKKDAAKAASAWLASKIDELRSKVADSDAKVENFRAQAGLLGVGNNMTAPGQQLADLNNQLAAARAAQSQAAARAQLMRSLLRDGRVVDAPELARDESLRRYAEQRVALKAQIAQESRTLLPGHPRMKELAAQLAGLDAEIALAVDKAAHGLENDARLAGSQVTSLNAALASQSKIVASGNVDEVALRALELDARSARDQLESYTQKYREAIARIADNASPADARVISVASPPRSPTFPKKAETLVLGTLAGLILSTGIAVSQALLSIDPIASPGQSAPAPVLVRDPAPAPARDRGEPVEPAAETPLRDAPASPGAPARVDIAADPPARDASPPPDGGARVDVAADPPARNAPPPAGGAARVDATVVPPRRDAVTAEALARRLMAGADEGGGMLALIAAEGSPAHSLPAALATARAMSLRGRTIFVDLGHTPHGIADAAFGDPEAEREPAGLAELVAGQASFIDAIQRDAASLLDIIRSGAGTVRGEGLDDVLEALGASYEFVVVHASDWRSEVALAALEDVHKLVVVAPASRLPEALVEAREAMRGASGDVLGFAAGERGALFGRAA